MQWQKLSARGEWGSENPWHAPFPLVPACVLHATASCPRSRLPRRSDERARASIVPLSRRMGQPRKEGSSGVMNGEAERGQHEKRKKKKKGPPASVRPLTFRAAAAAVGGRRVISERRIPFAGIQVRRVHVRAAQPSQGPLLLPPPSHCSLSLPLSPSVCLSVSTDGRLSGRQDNAG